MNNEISILFVDDNNMLDLNKRYRGIDRPTDVLSFPQIEGHENFKLRLPDSELILGDVVISLETAEKQAKDRGHHLEKEVLILLIHGILHLMRYDHEKSEGMEQEMRQKEEELLSLIKIKE
jgi:probable rRNA maturation factor